MFDVNHIWGRPPIGDSGKSKGNLARQTRHELDALEVNLTNQSQGSMIRNILIIFSEDDAKGVHDHHCDALVVTLPMANKCIHRILIDNRSLADILFLSTFARMRLERSRVKPYTTPFHGLAGGSVVPEGVIELLLSFRKSPTKVTTIVNFIVVDQSSSYNVVLGRLTLYAIKGTTSIYHYALKFQLKLELGLYKESKKKQMSIMR